MICPRCKGVGIVEEGNFRDSGTHTVTCYICKGSGRLIDEADDLRAQLADMAARRDAWRDRSIGYCKLTAAYRVGGVGGHKIADSALDLIKDAETRLRALGELE